MNLFLFREYIFKFHIDNDNIKKKKKFFVIIKIIFK